MPNEELNQPATPEEGVSEEVSSEEGDKIINEPEVSEEPAPQEYTKERFDGLMSARQRDRQELLEVRKELETLKQGNQPQKNQEDVWVDYLFNKIEERRTARQKAEDEAAQRELESVSTEFPGLDRKKILETATKYGTDLRVAAQFLNDMKSQIGVTKGLSEEDANRKKLASKIAGKPSGSIKSGLRPYDKERDKGKRPDELMEEGLEELGIK